MNGFWVCGTSLSWELAFPADVLVVLIFHCGRIEAMAPLSRMSGCVPMQYWDASLFSFRSRVMCLWLPATWPLSCDKRLLSALGSGQQGIERCCRSVGYVPVVRIGRL